MGLSPVNIRKSYRKPLISLVYYPECKRQRCDHLPKCTSQEWHADWDPEVISPSFPDIGSVSNLLLVSDQSDMLTACWYVPYMTLVLDQSLELD